jgi:site-specific recombinase XerD
MHEIRETIDRFLVIRQGQGLARATLELDRAALVPLGAWLEEQGIGWPELTPSSLATYLEALSSRRVAHGPRAGQVLTRSTIQIHMRAVRVWTAFLVDSGLLLLDPMRGIHLSRDDRLYVRGIFSSTDVERLFARLSEETPANLRERALFAVLYGGGLRVGEAVALDLVDYNPDDALVSIHKSKGCKGRLIPVGPATARDLDTYLARGRPMLSRRFGSPALFLNRYGTRLSTVRVGQRLRALQKQIGIVPLKGTHAFRHAFATEMLRAGASVRVVQKFLDHRRLETTARYTHVVLEDLRRALMRAHPRERTR